MDQSVDYILTRAGCSSAWGLAAKIGCSLAQCRIRVDLGRRCPFANRPGLAAPLPAIRCASQARHWLIQALI